MIRLIALLLCLASTAAIADTRAEFALGQCKFHTRESGTWYIDDQQTANSLISRCYQIGLHWKPSSSGFGLRGGWVDLGQFHGRNVAFIDDRDVGTAPNCNDTTARGCLSRYDGNGGVKGLAFGPTYEHKAGPFVLGGEIGAFVYKGWYDVEVTRLCNLPCGGDPRGLNFTYNNATGIERTWYWGVNARYDFLTLSYRVYRNVFEQGHDIGGDVGLTGKQVWQFAVGVSIPI